MKSYHHGVVTIRIHDGEDYIERQEKLEAAVKKLMKEVVKSESISTSNKSTRRN